jgi:hypothetical protein
MCPVHHLLSSYQFTSLLWLYPFPLFVVQSFPDIATTTGHTGCTGSGLRHRPVLSRIAGTYSFPIIFTSSSSLGRLYILLPIPIRPFPDSLILVQPSLDSSGTAQRTGYLLRQHPVLGRVVECYSFILSSHYSLPRSGRIWPITSSCLPSARHWDFPVVPAPDYVITRYSLPYPVPSQLPTVPFIIGISSMLFFSFLQHCASRLVCPAQLPVTPVTCDRPMVGSDAGSLVSYVIMLPYPFPSIPLYLRFHMLTYSISVLYFVPLVLLFPFWDVALTLLD